ncbi:MAG: ribonuclease R [Pseudomonadota bacterium]
MARQPMRRAKSVGAGLPTKEQILDYVQTAGAKVGKREIAKAFGIKGGDRIALKQLLSEMADDGLIAGNRKAVRPKGSLPPVTVLEIVDLDREGDLIAEPVSWDDAEGDRPRALVSETDQPVPARSGRGRSGIDRALGVGDRILAEVRPAMEDDGTSLRFVAVPMKRLPREKTRQLGIFKQTKRGGIISPVDRKALKEWQVTRDDAGRAKDGDLVRFELLRRGRFHAPQARIAEVIGNPSDQRQISLIAIHAHGIPDEFPESVLAELEDLPDLDDKGREDLRHIPLITIDPADARDHDDAVHAAPDPSPSNPGGVIVTVAIADVAYYVRHGSRLDHEAMRRGNSCYFPDRVVPMLPERISNDLCSLREQEDRPCLAVRMVFDASGRKQSHTFKRALMRSHVKLSYEEAQRAFEGQACDRTAPLLDTVIGPLWAAYGVVQRGRNARAPLDLDLPERKVRLGPDGAVRDIDVPQRLDAHRLIEEFMIQANVAAAETLEARKHAAVYRVHDQPGKEKLQGLRDFLATLSLKLPAANTLRPEHFNRVLQQAQSLPVPDLVSEVVLRSQSQAVYDVTNIGHFGLNLKRYAHFTSPIRRYADLLVHRALIAALDFGDDGMPREHQAKLRSIAQDISDLERRAMAAERETVERLIAAYLADRVGATFGARISGVSRSGLFVRLDETGADGFVPISTLDGLYHHDDTQHALICHALGTGYALGDRVTVRLVEAIPTAGALRFEMLSDGRRFTTKGGRQNRRRPGRTSSPRLRGRRR